MKAKKSKVEDAKNATRAGVEEGIIPGGGVALLRASIALDKFKDSDEDVTTGVQIVRRALQAPLRLIAFNAGLEPSVVCQKVLAGDTNFGLNAENGEYGDLIKMGVVDPAKVTRTALENAVSIASTVLTAEVLVSDIPEKKNHGGMPGEHSHGGGDF